MRTITLQRGGFYKHWKHDPAGTPGNKCYEVLNVGHTKVPNPNGGEDLDEMRVEYRPLYEDSFVFQQGKQNDEKKIEEWIKPVTGAFEKPRVRYELITDPEEIKILSEIRDRMYADIPKEIVVEIN